MRHILLSSTLFLILFTNILSAATTQVKGRVVDLHTGSGIPGVEVFAGEQGSITDSKGNYKLSLDSAEQITIRCIGYEQQSFPVAGLPSTIALRSKILEGQSIHVSATRVIPGITPVAYSLLDAEEIAVRHSVEDVPMILSSEAGVHAYSESGNGTGYSYVSIRGFDQSKIAVMVDNVPLNDNESHQVYWVDHGDILSNAQDVEIQRGVGSSLYGASAFGGSINIRTAIASDKEALNVGALSGSYNTSKYRIEYKSGARFGDALSLTARASILNSDGYREDSRSEQQSLMFALEHRGAGMTNQLRAIIGKELSILQWDGVSQDYLDSPELRRGKMPWTVPFTDDYLQQIYSLNTRVFINDHSTFRNVAYLVTGRGFYEVEKYDQSIYDYNLDVNDIYSGIVEQTTYTDLLRRKWINNIYFGITPIWTYEAHRWRSDIGFELRKYYGDHFGEVLEVSDSTIAAALPGVYEYYSYLGQKNLATAFGHFLLQITPRLTGSLDLRAQYIDWELDQAIIGHAPGVDLSADWQFFNPRIGFRYELTEALSVFAGIGSADKEPADAQIIEADDVWSTPVAAAAERVVNQELGMSFNNSWLHVNLNVYRIDYQNELISDIYDFQDGSFDVETADLTLHQGIELDFRSVLSKRLALDYNLSIAEHSLIGGDNDGNRLANVPQILANAHLQYSLGSNMLTALSLKTVGKQYIDQANTEEIAIPAYNLVSLFLQYKYADLSAQLKINNLLDAQYATYGYEYYGGYYWPGATRNYSINLNYSF